MSKNYLGFFLIICFFVGSIILNLHDSVDSIGYISRMLITLGCFSGVILWIWMMTDVFKSAGSAAWGWSLLLFNLLAAILYFLIVYRSRDMENRKITVPEDNNMDCDKGVG